MPPAVSVAATAPEPRTLDRVVVTANRIEQLQSGIGDSVTVIEPDEIRSSQRTMVADLLAATPGVVVSRNGGFGAVTSVRIRGAETDQTVVLIDGVKLNDPSSVGGGYNFGHLLANDDARIEILRGPQSTLWGSQAIGGVVNIVTSVPEGPLSGSLSAEGGARGTAALNARAEAGGERFAWRIGGNYLTTDGISSFDKRFGGSEKDGYRNVGFNVRGLLKLSAAASAELRSTWSKGRAEFDGFPPPAYGLADTGEYGYHEELVAYAGLNLTALDGRLSNRFGFAYTDTDREDFDPSNPYPKTFDATGRNERWEYQGTLLLNERWDAVFGLESETSQLETISAPSDFDPNPVPMKNDVRLDSAYAQLSTTALKTLTLTAGLRYDDHETFGDSTTGRAALAWSMTPTTLVRASYGEGFKAPTLYQLFSDYGNEALAAEKAEGWDAGIEQRLLDGTLVVSATYFSRDTNNMIDFVSCYGNADPRCVTRPFGFYDNLQKTTADGVELGLAAQLGERLRFTANYTSLDAQNATRSDANFGRALARRPKQTANASLSYAWPIGLTTTVAVQHAGRSFDDPANTIVLDDYTLVDLRATYAVTRTLEIFGRLENAFDEKYQTAAGYGSIGRGLFAGIRQAF
ncbi:hypothetical protein ACG33_01620 [Steroidobacter denitrificans]|uniref:TonB-dependent receptor n=1 Tax=Steroidobacter denitrificans TaxID=465721 RepID=A0A127F897_STEDE|nr:hypothetical protein ACG33_01620 [Steroidobacter denitrificans]